MNMFKDYPHKINILTDSTQKCVRRRLDDQEVLNKEILVQKFLGTQGFVPKVLKVEEGSYIEEYIQGTLFGKLQLEKILIARLAKVLSRLHRVVVPEDLFMKLQDKYTQSRVYRPRLILESIIRNLPVTLRRELVIRTRDLISSTEQFLNNNEYFFSIVHGDLSGSNIIEKDNGGVIIIDWSDVRVDIPSADVSQLFHLLDFTSEQKGIFLESYDIPFVQPKLLKVHEILLEVYDFADMYRTEPISPEKLLVQIDQILVTDGK